MNTIETLRRTIADLQALLDQAILSSELDKSIQNLHAPGITAGFIFRFVALEFHFTRDEITSHTRAHRVVWARAVISYLIKHYVPDTSFEEIGRMLNRDHSAIMRAIRMVEDHITFDRLRAGQVAALKTKIETSLHHSGQSGQSGQSSPANAPCGPITYAT